MSNDFESMSLNKPERAPRYQQQQQQQQQQNGSSQQNGHAGHKWRVGDSCLARYWEDNKFYPVDIRGLSKNTAVVFFKEYGNHEEVMLSDLAPERRRQQQQQQPASNFIPATPGLPPAFPQ